MDEIREQMNSNLGIYAFKDDYAQSNLRSN